MKMLMLILLMLMTFGDFFCKESPPQPHVPTVFLSAEDVGVTDAFLRVHLTRPDSLSTILIKRNGQVVLTARMGTRTDTLLSDDSLLPHETYIYKAYRTFQVPFDSSDAITVTTMDTTSHNFTWWIDTLGDGANSYLKDVAIVNDSCVFAVGEIHVKDSVGNWDPTLYNVARWDGRRWKYIAAASVTINAVYAFSDSDVWAGTTAPYHFDGVTWRGYNVTGLFDGYVTKIWGTSSTDIFMVGTNGAIMHFNGTSWEKMESGTDTDLLDVWGTPDGKTVWACGYRGRQTVLLRQRDGVWEKRFERSFPFTYLDDTLSGFLASVWTADSKRLFVATGNGPYRCFANTYGEAKRFAGVPNGFSGFPHRLRGIAIDDFWVVGDFSTISHFNGYTWKHYSELTTDHGSLLSVGQRGNIAVAVGYLYLSDLLSTTGVVFIGRR